MYRILYVTSEKKINEIQENTGIELDELQKRAVMEAVNCGILLISGGTDPVLAWYYGTYGA